MRRVARERKQEQFTALLHHVTVSLLRESFDALKKNAAPGVDGVTWRDYETGLEDRINDPHSRVHRGTYRAQPSRRVYIPKADGRQRPLGIAALEDKIVQQAVVTVLNQIYETDSRRRGFSTGSISTCAVNCSSGWRMDMPATTNPGKGAHGSKRSWRWVRRAATTSRRANTCVARSIR